MKSDSITPRTFLKSIRPEKFSDSTTIDKPTLDRSILEYHLSTITNRSEEVKFENFSRKLAEKEICPNLIPHTGPTGGGDSKVDSETYPVSEKLSMCWYEGIGSQAANERWGFAVSAIKVWTSKFKSDIKKIVKTKRGYTKIFFISNQYIPDKKRSEAEDKARKLYKIDIRILDRSWILDKVFSNQREELAIEALSLSSSLRKEVRLGPLDLKRQQDLEIIEKRISTVVQSDQESQLVVDDCLEIALIARGLDRPRTEVEGLFARASRFADKVGTRHQRICIAYEKARTAFWWYEDFEQFFKEYVHAEKFALDTPNVYDLELIVGLWFCFRSIIQKSDITEKHEDFKKHTDILLSELTRVINSHERASASLQAKALKLRIQLLNADLGKISTYLEELESVVKECEGLIGFPLETLVDMLSVMGELYAKEPAYRKLFNTIVEITSKRRGDVSASKMLLNHAAQNLSVGEPYQAIKLLTHATVGLFKNESYKEEVVALYMLATAYEEVGLYWAARGSLLCGSSIAGGELRKLSDATPLHVQCIRRLKWLELRLGRILQSLSFHRLELQLRDAVDRDSKQDEASRIDDSHYDAILGIVILKANLYTIAKMSRMPDSLERLSLFLSQSSLLYVLGYDSEIDPVFLEAWTKSGTLFDHFQKLRKQPAAFDCSELDLCDEQTVTFKSKIMGCEITVKTENNSPCIELSESIIAALEGFMATGFLYRFICREPRMLLKVRKSDFSAEPFSFTFDEQKSPPTIEVSCSDFNANSIKIEKQKLIKDKIFEILATAMAASYILPKYSEDLMTLFRDERAQDRALNFSSSFIVLKNIIGENPPHTIDDWYLPEFKDYTIIRTADWDHGHRGGYLKPSHEEKDGPYDIHNARHDEVGISTIIKLNLWDKAGWNATAYLFDPAAERPPLIALVYRDGDAARKIFSEWKSTLGMKDSDERIRISIIRGINKDHPHWYRVVIGENISKKKSDNNSTRLVYLLSRINTMEPETSENLENFIKIMESTKVYGLTFMIFSGDINTSEVAFENIIYKSEIFIRQAWEVAEQDLDSAGILPEDNPIIPEGILDPPVLKVIQRKKS